MKSKIACPHCGATVEISLRVASRHSRKFDHDQALALLRFGATQAEVARVFGVSRQRISQLANRAIA